MEENKIADDVKEAADTDKSAPAGKKGPVSTEEKGERRAVLVGIYRQGDEAECLDGIAELERLLDTAGGVCAGIVTQCRPAPDSRTCIGQGKMKELSELCKNEGAELAVFDLELSPAQIRCIEDDLGGDIRVIDRSMLILDIFADHAASAEGRLQVELAQLKYTAPRLMGQGKAMSRLGGGIGTRGPGESKLEIDRRRIKNRIAALEEELRGVEKNRSTIRAARDRSGVTKCAIVGYTNAGKSTLLNRLTDAGILAEDKLFATLDPTTRQYTLPKGRKILLTDTVGFIKNLPHHLIKSFKSTLDEAALADVLIVVADASDVNARSQIAVAEQLIDELNAGGKPTLYVFNKCDRCHEDGSLSALKRAAADVGAKCVFISALTGEGIEEFSDTLEEICSEGRKAVRMLIPQGRGDLVSILYRDAENVECEYTDDGVAATATVDEKTFGRFSEYIISD
jgi:GTP-binding protein HflX